jgi:hypothetical protein
MLTATLTVGWKKPKQLVSPVDLHPGLIEGPWKQYDRLARLLGQK